MQADQVSKSRAACCLSGMRGRMEPDACAPAPGGEDKDLIFQAHTGTTVLDTLRCAHGCDYG